MAQRWDLLPVEREALELARARKKSARKGPPVDLTAGLFEAQRRVWDDPRSRLALLTGRRAGKTHLAAPWLVRALKGEQQTSLYVSTTRIAAKRQLWPELKTLARRLKAKINESELSVEIPSGGRVVVGGCDDRAQVERWRGEVRVAAVWVDECGAWPPELLETFTEEVIEPAAVDLDASIVLAGTPGRLLRGYWWELTAGSRRTDALHHWTMFQNAALPNAREIAERIKADRGWTDDSATWVREYLGRWVEDAGALVYPYDPARNGCGELPRPAIDGYWRWVIGVDVGVTDPTAIVVAGAHAWHREVFLVHAEKAVGQLTGQLAQRLRDLRTSYPGASIVLDTGGMGKAHEVELRSRFGISVIAAEKREKASAIRVFRDALLSGEIKVLDGAALDDLREEYSALGWDERGEGHDKTGVDHACDAALYAHRYLRHYVYHERLAAPAYGSQAYHERIERELRDAALKRSVRALRSIRREERW